MSTSVTVTRHSRQYSLQSNMDSAADKEERKREYNRLAQREFRRRRKEHLKNLEQAQRDQSSEQSEEIERLRFQNDELRRENEALRTQLYGSSSMGSMTVNSLSDNRSYSLSPSISGTSMSGTSSPPATLGGEMLPMHSLSMMPPTMQAYADSSPMSSQPAYSMVHPSGLRHDIKSSPESSGFRSSRSAMGPHFQSLDVRSTLLAEPQGRSDSDPASMVLTPCDATTTRSILQALFRPFADPAIRSTSKVHLAVLHSLHDSLPDVLRPSPAQLTQSHHYGIDMIASPTLRERLMTHGLDVVESFLADFAPVFTGEGKDNQHVLIWGADPLNEMAWEVVPTILERWDFLLGKEWVNRANFWRRQRGVPLLSGW